MFYNKKKSFEKKYSRGFFPFFASFQTFTATILLAHIFSFKSNILLFVFQIQEYNMGKNFKQNFPLLVWFEGCDVTESSHYVRKIAHCLDSAWVTIKISSPPLQSGKWEI